MEEVVLHDPVDEKESQECEDGEYGLEADEEAGKDKEIDNIDVLIADLELLFFIELVDFVLVEAEFVLW